MRKRTCFSCLLLTTGRDRCSFAVAQMGHTSTGSAQGCYVPVGSGGGQELKMTVLSALAPSHFPLSKVCVSHRLGEVVMQMFRK